MNVSRRTAMQAVAAGAAGVALGAAPARASAAILIEAGGITVTAEADGSILVSDTVDRVRISHFMFKDSVIGQQRTFGGKATLTTDNGSPAIRVDYTMSASAQGVKVTGLFTVSPRRVGMRWTVTGSTTLTPSGFMFARTVLNPSAPEGFAPIATWVRDQGGGVPYEVNAGALYQETWTDTTASFWVGATTRKLTNATWLHAPGDANNVTDAALVFGAGRTADLAARGAGVLGVDAWSDQPFGLYGTAAAMRLKAQVVNGTPVARTLDLVWWARDFSGTKVAGGTLTRTLAPGAVWDEAFTIQGAPQDIVFTEVSAGEAFARTNMATLKTHAYKPEGRFGIANYAWLMVPGRATVGGLLQKLGVKSVRISYEGGDGLSPAELDGLGIPHNVQLGGVLFNGAQADIDAWADKQTGVAKAAGARYFEVGNELNNPWMQGLRAKEYIRDGLRPIRERLQGSGIKVMNCGLGGMDWKWTQSFKAEGGWDLIDAFAFHPGRGNFTPDYAPPREEWVVSDSGTYWNFLGALKEARRTVNEYGGAKELWLTEAYACTRPNRWWNDSHRHAAENVLLTLALAMSEGVDGVNWYQPHDSIIHQPQVADPANHEYHYGLMNRDTSAKASLLAYANATRTLEGATFVRWLTFPDPDLKGLLFDKFSILWSRKDGYIQHDDHGTDAYHPHKEAWVDHWPTKTSLTLPAKGANVHEVDCIGHERWIASQNGQVTLNLDGAPRIYYGLA